MVTIASQTLLLYDIDRAPLCSDTPYKITQSSCTTFHTSPPELCKSQRRMCLHTAAVRRSWVFTCTTIQIVKLCSYQLRSSKISVPLHAEVLVELTEHSQQDVNRIPAAAAAALYSVTEAQTPRVLTAVAAAAAVMLTGPGCLATAVDSADQRLAQTAGECIVQGRKKTKVRKHGDWHELAAE